MSKCAYCDKKEDTDQCPHCKKYYCAEHFNPIEPGSYHPENSRIFINQIRLGNEHAHPCGPYVDYLAEQKKIQDEKWKKTLDDLSGKNTISKKIPYDEISKEKHKEKDSVIEIYPINISNTNTHTKRKQRIPRFSKLLKWILIIIIILTVLILQINPSFLKLNKSNLNNFLTDSKSIEKSQCIDEAKKLIPKNLTLYQPYGLNERWVFSSYTFCGKETIEYLPNWNDGERLLTDWRHRWKQGSSQGENINLYYYDAGGGIPYSKRIISQNGIVLGDSTFKMKPLLKPIINTSRICFGYSNEPIQDFEVIEPNIVECNWISEDQ